MSTVLPVDHRVDVDPARWPDVARVPSGAGVPIASRIAESVFRATLSRLQVRVLDPGGEISGGGADSEGVPTLVLHRPDRFFARLGSSGLIGFGESYLAGEWDCADLPALIAVFAARIETLVPASLQRWRTAWVRRIPHRERPTEQNSRHNVARHYDLSNAMFAQFLDETMSYSSALFEAGGPDDWDTLADAQRRKLDRLLDVAGVGPGSRVLEIGTGWGELSLRAAARGASVHSVSLSSEQLAWAGERLREAGLHDRVTLGLTDYRAVEGRYDAVVSVEMIEAVGYRYWPAFFASVDRVLEPGGRLAMQAITTSHHRVLATRDTYTWILKYIFPGGGLTSVEGLDAAAREVGLRGVSDHSFGQHYARTLHLWRERFDSRHDEVRALGFDEVFLRLWHFYLAYSEGGFRAGYLDVHQLVWAKP